MIEFCYVAEANTVWNCVTCGCYVTSEPITGWSKNGQPATLFTPASRYWKPGSKPGFTEGVFCRYECAHGSDGIFISTIAKPIEKCPDALLPDGPRCPRCFGERGPSGIDGGSWVHIHTPSANNENPEGL